MYVKNWLALIRIRKNSSFDPRTFKLKSCIIFFEFENMESKTKWHFPAIWITTVLFNLKFNIILSSQKQDCPKYNKKDLEGQGFNIFTEILLWTGVKCWE